MIINKITLENFRQYNGKQELVFSTDDKKNVTVILGQNTGGKTTLVQAFLWCLYGETNFTKKELINTEVLKALAYGASIDVIVEIKLKHKEKIYTIRRSQKFSKDYSGKIKSEQARLKVVYKQSNGETQDISMEGDSEINKILPYKLSNYFFFAGEHVKEISRKGNVKEAVRGLMGLDAISNAVDRLSPKKTGSVYSKLYNELDTGFDHRTGKLKSDLEDAKKSLENYVRRKSELETEKNSLQASIDEKDRFLLSNAAIKEKQEEKIRLEKEISDLGNSLIEKEKRIVNDFMRGHYKFFAKSIFPKILKVIAEAKTDGVGVPDMHAKSIDHLIERGKCICGTPLTNNTRALADLEHEKSLLPPAHIGTLIRTFKERCEACANESDDYFSTIENSYKDIRFAKNSIDEKKSRLKLISEQIQGSTDVGKVERERNELKASLDRCMDTLIGNASRIAETNRDIENIRKQIDGFAVASDKNTKIKLSLAYCQAVYEWFKESYDKKIKEVNDGLNESISRIFAKMFHGQRIVEVDENYRVTLKIDDGRGGYALDTSMGEETVKNFAFVSGLIDFARNKAYKNDRESADISTEPYPLVMDAAFSETDDEHIANIAKALPTIAEQVIFIVMRKDWNYADPVVRDYVGKMYEIEKHTATTASFKEVK